MTKEELAEKLNGNQYGSETRGMEVAARQSGLVIVYGASDDLMEFRGAIFNEVGAYDGGTAYVTPSGLIDEACDSDCKYYRAARDKATPVKALWCIGDGYSWTHETTTPHATFDIFEGEEKYCRGIMFSLADVPAAA